MDNTESAAPEIDKRLDASTTSLVLLVELPAFGVEHRVCFDVNPFCHHKVLNKVQELVAQLQRSLPDELIPLGGHRNSDLIALRREAKYELEKMHEEMQYVESWKSQSKYHVDEMRKMRDTYLKDLLQLREQLFQRNKAMFDKSDWTPCCTTVFDPCVFTTCEEDSKLLGQKRDMLAQEFELRLWEIQKQYRVRHRVLHEQLLASAVSLQYKTKLCAKLLETHGYEDEREVQRKLGKVVVSVPKIARQLDKRLHAAEHVCREGPRHIHEKPEKPARRQSVPAVSVAKVMGHTRTEPDPHMSALPEDATHEDGAMSSDMQKGNKPSTSAAASRSRRISAPAQVMWNHRTVQDSLSVNLKKAALAFGNAASDGNRGKVQPDEVGTIKEEDADEGDDDNLSTEEEESEMLDSSSDSEWEEKDEYLPISPGLGSEEVSDHQLKQALRRPRNVSCDWRGLMMKMSTLAKATNRDAGVQVGLNPRLQIESLLELDEAQACFYGAQHQENACNREKGVQAVPRMACMAIQCVTEAPDDGDSLDKKLEKLLEQAVDVKKTLADMRQRSEDLENYEPAEKLLAWLAHVTSNPGEKRKTFQELCKDFHRVSYVTRAMKRNESDHSGQSRSSSPSAKDAVETEALEMKEAEPSPEPAPTEAAEHPEDVLKLSFKSKTNGKPHFSRNGRLPPRKLGDAFRPKSAGRFASREANPQSKFNIDLACEAEQMELSPSPPPSYRSRNSGSEPSPIGHGQCRCQGQCQCFGIDITQFCRAASPEVAPKGFEISNCQRSGARAITQSGAPSEAVRPLKTQWLKNKSRTAGTIEDLAADEPSAEPKAPASPGSAKRPWSGAPGRNLKGVQRQDFYSAPAWMHSQDQAQRDGKKVEHPVSAEGSSPASPREPSRSSQTHRSGSARFGAVVNRAIRPASAFTRAAVMKEDTDQRHTDPPSERLSNMIGDLSPTSPERSQSRGKRPIVPTTRPTPSLSLNRAAIHTRRKGQMQNSGNGPGGINSVSIGVKPGPPEV